MKLPKLMRPKIIIKYKGLKGFILTIYAISISCIHRVNAVIKIGKEKVISENKIWVIPKYKIEKTKEDFDIEIYGDDNYEENHIV